jgi:hypothetical protein
LEERHGISNSGPWILNNEPPYIHVQLSERIEKHSCPISRPEDTIVGGIVTIISPGKSKGRPSGNSQTAYNIIAYLNKQQCMIQSLKQKESRKYWKCNCKIAHKVQ